MRVIGLFSAVFVLLNATSLAQTTSAQPYRIGVTYPLTGSLATSGTQYLPAAQIAVADINRAGGVHGHPLELVVEDSLGTPEGGIAAMRKLVEVNGVQAILTIYTNVIEAQMPLADQLKVPLLSPVESPGLVNKSVYAFSHAVSTTSSGDAFRDYWRRHHLKRVYAFVPNNANGQFFSAAFRAAAAELGDTYAESSYDLGDSDYRGLVDRAKAFGPDALVVAEQGGVDATVIIRELREAGLSAPIFTPGIFYNEPEWRNGVGPYIGGVMMAGLVVDPKAGKQFISEYQAKTGDYPGYVSGEVYDMVRMFAAAIGASSYNGEAIRNQLATLKGVPSVFGGTITMAPDHYSIPSNETLWHVSNGAVVQVQ